MSGVKISSFFGGLPTLFPPSHKSTPTFFYTTSFDFLLEFNNKDHLVTIFQKEPLAGYMEKAFQIHLEKGDIDDEKNAFPLFIGCKLTKRTGIYMFYMIDHHSNEVLIPVLSREFVGITAFFGIKPTVLFNGRLTDPLLVHYSKTVFDGFYIFDSKEDAHLILPKDSRIRSQFTKALVHHQNNLRPENPFPCQVAFRRSPINKKLSEFYFLAKLYQGEEEESED